LPKLLIRLNHDNHHRQQRTRKGMKRKNTIPKGERLEKYIRYFRYKGTFDYYAVCVDRVIAISENGYAYLSGYDGGELITNYHLGLGLIELKGDMIPDPDRIEERYLIDLLHIGWAEFKK